MIKINLQKNNGPAPYEVKNFRSGFVILFAVTLAAILLSIALGVADIAFKEIKFGTSAKDTNEAFFAADTGVEQVLFWDRSDTDPLIFEPPITDGETKTYESPYIFPGLGSTGNSCANVTIEKTFTNSTGVKTVIISKGYNNSSCVFNSNTVERQLEVRY